MSTFCPEQVQGRVTNCPVKPGWVGHSSSRATEWISGEKEMIIKIAILVDDYSEFLSNMQCVTYLPAGLSPCGPLASHALLLCPICLVNIILSQHWSAVFISSGKISLSFLTWSHFPLICSLRWFHSYNFLFEQSLHKYLFSLFDDKLRERKT